jgi:hypothetical protein
MTPLTAADVRALLTPPAGPCVSVYMPTNRPEPARREDPIRYRELVRAVAADLKAKHPGHDALGLVRRLEAVADDADLWANALDGLAVLAGGEQVRVFRLPRRVTELAVVADSFHLKPLLRITQSADRFHVLAITRTDARVFEGDRYGLRPVERVLPTWNEAVGVPLDRPHGPGLTAGAGAGKVEIGQHADEWFRAVDRAVTDKLTRQTDLPLVLVGLPDNTSEFRRITKNPNLLSPDVSGDPGAMTLDRIREAAWNVVLPRYTERLARLTEGFGTAKAHGTGSADPQAIGAALVQGRVGLLLADADRVIPGRVDPASGAVRTVDAGDAAADDLIDDLAELTLKTGGEVVVVPSDRMPCDTGVAAVYRY